MVMDRIVWRTFFKLKKNNEGTEILCNSHPDRYWQMDPTNTKKLTLLIRHINGYIFQPCKKNSKHLFWILYWYHPPVRNSRCGCNWSMKQIDWLYRLSPLANVLPSNSSSCTLYLYNSDILRICKEYYL